MPVRADTQATRQAIVAAAAELFARHGVDAVSLGQIGRAAGQKNNSAVQYHFGDRRSILRAILDDHVPGIDARRVQLLDATKAPLTLRELGTILVEPVADKLDDPAGVAFVQISAQLAGHPTYPLFEFDQEASLEGRRRLAVQVATLLPPMPGEVLLARRSLLVSLLFHGLADYSRQPSITPVSRQLFVNNLIDIVVANLQTPPSPATLACL